MESLEGANELRRVSLNFIEYLTVVTHAII